MIRSVFVVGWVLAISLSAPAQDPSRLPAGAGEREGQALVTELLTMMPPETVFYGVLRRVAGSEGGRTEVPMRYTISTNDAPNWQGIYETQPLGQQKGERLMIIHSQGEPNRYRYTADSESKNEIVLTGSEANIPFAGSDYWLSDLGMDFLHWPEQRTIKHKITMRSSVACKVLESVNPRPDQGYARVLSWISVESGALIYAEAYDRDRRRMKVFSLHGFKKVNGTWQASILEIQNARSGSRSQIEFRFESPR